MHALSLTLPTTRTLSAVEHLALYGTFHRAESNRLIHHLAQPLVLLSALMPLALVRLPMTGALAPLLHPGTLLAFLLAGLLARLDGRGAAVVLAGSLALSWIAGVAALVLPPAMVLGLAALLHAGAWTLAVKLGHEHLEPRLDTPDGVEDSNLYFRRGYFHGANLGIELTPLDRLTQFAIAPLATARELLALAGVVLSEETEIDGLRDRFVAQLGWGLPLFR